MDNKIENTEKGIDNPAFELNAAEIQCKENPENFDSEIATFQDLPPNDFNHMETFLDKFQKCQQKLCTGSNKTVKLIIKVVLVILCKIYFIGAIVHQIQSGKTELDFCHGFGFLVIFVVFIDLCFFYYKLLKPCVSVWLETSQGLKN